MRQVLKQLKPDRIEDIIAVVALYRPGPMENIPSYINRKHNKEITSYAHPILQNILRETHGIMIYQEQVMEAARLIAGFTLVKADLLRRAIGKKIKSEMLELKSSFIDGSKSNNINISQAKKIFNDIEKFAGYGFNKSHAAAYAIISYQTAWFKTNYPAEFFVSFLNSEIINASEKYSSIKSDMEKLDINLLKPDINKSLVYFSVDYSEKRKTIRSGLVNIKNISGELAEYIVHERESNGSYKSIIDFFSRLNPQILNKRQIEYLAMAGVFDELKLDRASIFFSAANLLLISQNIHKEKKSNQQRLFSNDNSEQNFQHLFKNVNSWKKNLFYLNEFYALGFLVSGHPLEEETKYFERFNLSSFNLIEENNVNGKTFELLVFLIKYEEKSIGNTRFLDMFFIDNKGFFNLRVFRDKLDEFNIKIDEGKSYIITVIHSLDRDNRLRLNLKSIIEANSIKNAYFDLFSF